MKVNEKIAIEHGLKKDEYKNILGMMPHPERMADKVLSGEDGLGLFLSLMN